VQVRDITGRGAAGVNHHHFRATRLFRRNQPLIEHRMTPCQIAAHQHHQIGLVQILVCAGHDIRAKGPVVPGNGRGHAQPRIGVHICGAHIALDQLVGGIVILGQHLPRQIEGGAIGPVIADGRPETLGHQIKRYVPCGRRATDQGGQDPSVQPQRFAQGCAFGT